MKKNTEFKIALIGEKFWCENLKNQLTEEGVSANILKKPSANPLKQMLWLIYFQKEIKEYSILHIMSPYGNKKILKASQKLNAPIICHWIGSDAYKLEDPNKKKTFVKYCSENLIHLAVSNRLRKELENNGFEVAYVIPNVTNTVLSKAEPLPEKPAFLSYWHDKRAEFFNYALIFKAARAFPETTFKIIGATGENLNPPSNVHFVGFQKNVRPYILNSTAYIRLTPHDGQLIPMMVAEVLSMGRYVIYNHRVPHCEYASTFEELKSKIVEILNRKEPNYEGSKYVQKELNPKDNINKIIKLYQKLLFDEWSNNDNI